MILVSGQIWVEPADSDAYLQASRDAIVEARRADGCRDFVVAADPIENGRINVYEEWESREALQAFRGAGPSDQLKEMIVSAEVSEHEVDPG